MFGRLDEVVEESGEIAAVRRPGVQGAAKEAGRKRIKGRDATTIGIQQSIRLPAVDLQINE